MLLSHSRLQRSLLNRILNFRYQQLPFLILRQPMRLSSPGSCSHGLRASGLAYVETFIFFTKTLEFRRLCSYFSRRAGGRSSRAPSTKPPFDSRYVNAWVDSAINSERPISRALSSTKRISFLPIPWFSCDGST